MQLSDAEWVVMDAIWDRGEASVRDVLDAVGPDTGWAYSTVKTTMTRLVEKGALRVRKEGKAGVFEPALTRQGARQSALRGLLDRAFDGTFGALVAHLCGHEKLKPEEREALRAIARQPAPKPAAPKGKRR